MSGIEVAGLILGAFPVAIWALEQYRDVARRMGFWYEIRSEYQRSSNELKFHRLSFERNLEQLLLPSFKDDARLQSLIADPGGPAWKNPDIQDALEARLQKSYHLYLEILGEMKRAMQDLNDELAVDEVGIQSRVRDSTAAQSSKITPTSSFRRSIGRPNRDYQIFRVKFSMGERTRTRLFGELQIYNDRLEKLTSTSDIVSGLQGAKSPLNSALCKFWNHADRLYKALQGAWNCACYEQHCAQLMLQHRITAGERDFQLNLLPVDCPLGIGETGSANCGSSTSSWSACSVRVKMLDRPQPTTALHPICITKTTANGTVAAPLATPQHKLKAPSKSGFQVAPEIKKMKKVSIGLQQVGFNTSGYCSTVTLTMPQKPNAPSAETPLNPTSTEPKIENLCESLANVKPPSRIGYLEDDNDVRYHIDSEYLQVSPDVGRTKLSQILSGDIQPPLTRRQRYRLSLTIASSFLQLKDTPWLQTWDKRSVCFSRNDVNTLMLDAPFAVRTFSPLKTNPAQAGHDVDAVVSLGILLLELCFGRVIEQHPKRVVLPAGDDNVGIKAAFDLMVALEWLKDVYDEAGADYTEAVEWCLAGCRTIGKDGAWRQHLLEKVISPLERCNTYLG